MLSSKKKVTGGLISWWKDIVNNPSTHPGYFLVMSYGKIKEKES